jgi:hypothetical protein
VPIESRWRRQAALRHADDFFVLRKDLFLFYISSSKPIKYASSLRGCVDSGGVNVGGSDTDDGGMLPGGSGGIGCTRVGGR